MNTTIKTILSGIMIILPLSVKTRAESGAAKAAIPLRYTIATETIGKRHFQVKALGLYATDIMYAIAVEGKRGILDETNAPHPANVPHSITSAGYVGYGLLPMCDIALSLPFYTDITSWGGVYNSLGDLRADILYVVKAGTDSSMFGIAGKLGAVFPTGNKESLLFPRDMWQINGMTTVLGHKLLFKNKLYLNPAVAGTFNLLQTKSRFPLKIHGTIGAIFSDKKETFATDLTLSFETVFNRFPQLSLEFNAVTRPMVSGRSLFDAIAADPFRIVPSVGFSFTNGLAVLVAAEAGISNGKGAFRNNWYRGGFLFATKSVPFYGASVTLSFTGTTLLPQRIHGSSVTNQYDKDLDGIPDSLDACKGTPEDADGFEDSDGCPEYDNDNDGIVDEADGCPNRAEDKDSFEDSDGCPDDDNDNDGVADSIDACPDSRGLEKYKGCPDEEIVSFTRSVLSDIGFGEGTSKIVSGTETLDKIYTMMSKNPKMSIEIQVHTDNRGSSAASSTLSQSRADMIKLYLVSKGIRPNKIKALGLGSEFPIADNSTEEGRAKNQRVEVRRVD